MAVQTGEWWKKPAPKQWWQQPIKKQKAWYEVVGEQKAAQNRMARPASQKAQGGGGGPQVQSVTDVNTGAGGGGGGYSYDPVAAAAAAKVAEDNRKRGELRGKAGSYLDQLAAMYKEMIGLVEKVGADSTGRINKSYDEKILDQVDAMNEGMYTSDAANAANNLASSSWMAFDRGKIRKAKEANEKTLNEGRANDLSTIGKMVSEDTSRYRADSDNLGRTRELLGGTEDIGELTSTVNNLGNTIASTQAAKGKYGSQGEFVGKANALGNYDTSVLEKTMQSIISSTSASPQAKQAAMDDLLKGTPLDENKKKELKTKYTQVV